MKPSNIVHTRFCLALEKYEVSRDTPKKPFVICSATPIAQYSTYYTQYLTSLPTSLSFSIASTVESLNNGHCETSFFGC